MPNKFCTVQDFRLSLYEVLSQRDFRNAEKLLLYYFNLLFEGPFLSSITVISGQIPTLPEKA